MEFNTTFMGDFTIAEQFGPAAVQDTYERVFQQWHDDYRYLTDLVIVLNRKLWSHWEKDPDSPLPPSTTSCGQRPTITHWTT